MPASSEICQRAYRILVDRVGFPPEDIIFGPNIFAVATGIGRHNKLRGGLHRGGEGTSKASTCPTP